MRKDAVEEFFRLVKEGVNDMNDPRLVQLRRGMSKAELNRLAERLVQGWRRFSELAAS